jgi:hypothetical protein
MQNITFFKKFKLLVSRLALRSCAHDFLQLFFCFCLINSLKNPDIVWKEVEEARLILEERREVENFRKDLMDSAHLAKERESYRGMCEKFNFYSMRNQKRLFVHFLHCSNLEVNFAKTLSGTTLFVSQVGSPRAQYGSKGKKCTAGAILLPFYFFLRAGQAVAPCHFNL